MTATPKTPRYYPAEDIKVKKPILKVKQNPPKIRKSITRGTVVILLAGKFRGKRVVCLKALASGLLLVTGPYKVNGVPLRRVCPAFVIATSTKIDVSKIDVKKYTDEYFTKMKEANKAGEDDFFDDKKKGGGSSKVSEERKADQKKMDDAVLGIIQKTDMLEGYLAARFSLKAHDKPHLMKF